MASKQTNNSRLMRERAVYDYLEFLKNGDIDGIITILQQAMYDAALDQMIVDAHQAYFQDEQRGKAELTDLHTQQMPALEQTTLHLSRPGQRRRRESRQMPYWAQTFVAVLIVGILVGSFITVLALRRSSEGTSPRPPVCQPYPLKQFDAQYNEITTAS
jgi:hypothetical protein